MSFFFLMLAKLLSGFAIPFRGMPRWAQVIAEILTVTRFNRVIRSIMLKGAGREQVAFEIVIARAIGRYRMTLD